MEVNVGFEFLERLRGVPSSGTVLCLPPAFPLVSCSVYSSTLNMEATRSSDASVGFQRTTRCRIPEDMGLYVFIVVFCNVFARSGVYIYIYIYIYI
jgi:hypothetical protein